MPKLPRAGRPVASAALLALALLAAPPAAAQDVRLDSAAWRSLNVFFSNFAEAEVEPFRRGEVPHLALVQFGVTHLLINTPERVEYVEDAPRPLGYENRLRASLVGAAVTRYFGVRLSHHAWPSGDRDRVEYVDGHYYFAVADYPVIPFAQVSRLLDVGGGEFVADVGVYASLDVGGDYAHATPVEEMRRAGNEVGDGREMRARIRRVREGGRERYVLLEWLPAP